MTRSSCTAAFLRNDLQRNRLDEGKCPVRNCHCDLSTVPFRRHKGEIQSLPFCPEHGIRIHRNTFVYYNGPSGMDRITAIRRNLYFHAEYYVRNILGTSGKIESHRLCYENSEDAVTFGVFTSLLSDEHALQELSRSITQAEP